MEHVVYYQKTVTFLLQLQQETVKERFVPFPTYQDPGSVFSSDTVRIVHIYGRGPRLRVSRRS